MIGTLAPAELKDRNERSERGPPDERERMTWYNEPSNPDQTGQIEEEKERVTQRARKKRSGSGGDDKKMPAGNKAMVLRLIEGGKPDEKPPPPEKLTAKQRKFVDSFLKGLNESDAYRAAYDAENTNDNTIHREASKLMLNPKVAATIRKRLVAREAASVQSAVSRRRFVLERLTKEATDATNDGARVRALELLGKTPGVDLFRDVVADVEDTQSPDELLAEVERRLKEEFSKQ